MTDWKIFRGDGVPHDDLGRLPKPPPWRFARSSTAITGAGSVDPAEARRAGPFQPSDEMIRAVNAALYLRRPLLLTGKPGAGKSTLISKVAHELKLGRVIRWPINSRSTVRAGVYDYDAVGRLQAGTAEPSAIELYLKLGPLGTALARRGRPVALLIDEIDKSDLDFANDLLNVIEEGEYEIPELRRLDRDTVTVRDAFGDPVAIHHGLLRSDHFPFVVMTSNAEREFPAPFLRRCIRLDVMTPSRAEIERIVRAHLALHDKAIPQSVTDLIDAFETANGTGDVSTDQLLNAIFLTVTLRDRDSRSFSNGELVQLKADLLRPIAGPAA